MHDRSTITIRQEVKDRLALAKGDRSWDEFLQEVADERIDDAIALAERRLEELRSHKAKSVSLAELDADIAKMTEKAHEVPQARKRARAAVERPDPPRRQRRDPRARGG